MAFLHLQITRGSKGAELWLAESNNIHLVLEALEKEQSRKEQTACQTARVLEGFVSNSEGRLWQTKPLFQA